VDNSAHLLHACYPASQFIDPRQLPWARRGCLHSHHPRPAPRVPL